MKIFSLNKRADGQAQTIATSGLLFPFVVSFVLFAFILLICVALTAMDTDKSMNHSQLRGIKYSTSNNIDELMENTDGMIDINSISDIKRKNGDKFIRLSFNIPASNAVRNLSLNTYFSQVLVLANHTEVFNTIDIANIFSSKAGENIKIEPSDEAVFLDVVVKSEFMPKLSIIITPPRAEIASGLTTVMTLSVISLVFYCVFIFIRKKKRLLYSFKMVYGIPFLLFTASAGFIVSLYINSSGIMVMRFAIAGISLAEIILLNYFIKESPFNDKLRQTIISIGLVGMSLTLIGQYQAIAVFLLKLFWFYFPICIIYLFINNVIKSSVRKFTFDELALCYLLFFQHIALSSFFMLDSVFELFYLPLLVCSAYFIMFGIYTILVSFKIFKPHLKKINDDSLSERLNIFKPNNLGRLQDLLEIFLKNEIDYFHSRNVSLYTYIICKNSDMSKSQSGLIAQAAYLHDIGKMMLPMKLTMSDKILTGNEYEEMKKHTTFGYNLFSGDDSEILKAAAIIAKSHHERYDGNGYFGLSGDQIHTYVQIVSIADVFDAVTSERTYKKAWTFEEAFKHIRDGAGSLFAKNYVDVFVKSRDEIYKVYCEIKQSEEG
ncbi:MAG: HD domain-containing protein [Eubacteriales bacterium]|nr:HD domain-containing protein [Oscillospiraceae bacterium]MDD4495926.1 HD domain-containing protein [Eubacteriales bacterium]